MRTVDVVTPRHLDGDGPPLRNVYWIGGGSGSGKPAIAEGFRLLPDLVQPLLADPRHAV